MPGNTLCKIVRQYNKIPIPPEQMQKLQEIAVDYSYVKNQVYQRYGGVGGLSKLYPGYTVQNEMTQSGLRERLGLPAVYFYLAVFDGLRDIKIQWSRTKTLVLKRVNGNSGFLEEEKHFLRFLLRVNNAFEAVLNSTDLKLPTDIRRQYDSLATRVQAGRLENYLRRQVRNLHGKPESHREDGFSIGERAYRYGDHGIYISVREKRKRIYIPLTDGNQYDRQLFIRLFPDKSSVEIQVPVYVAIKKHENYTRHLGVSMGMCTMLVTEEGHIYGEELGSYQARLSDWLREQSSMYNQNRMANPGRKKYNTKKQRLEEQLRSYINQELNRFLREEQPELIYIPKLPGPGVCGPVKRINHLASTWQRGYILGRLKQKCTEQSVELVEIFGKGISVQCSRCGAQGVSRREEFFCSWCGLEINKKQNAALNARRRGEENRSGFDF
ncbi:MAG: transposase [Lachnospiraceae bacterium]|nr:transposase [Lachnospiraceae bacterium]